MIEFRGQRRGVDRWDTAPSGGGHHVRDDQYGAALAATDSVAMSNAKASSGLPRAAGARAPAAKKSRAILVAETRSTLPETAAASAVAKQIPQAVEPMLTTVRMPAAGDASASPDTDPAARDEVHTHRFAPQAGGAPVPPETIAALRELQRARQFAIVSQSMTNRRCESFIVRVLGFRVDMEPAQRKAVFAQASAMRRMVEKGDGEGLRSLDNQTGCALSVCSPIILKSQIARAAWDGHRAVVEKEMRKLARTLPVHEWASSVAGFGDLGLAIIVGEAGDLATYDTKERVWKRLGLAVIEGLRQQRRSDKDQAAAHGYNPKRRAEVWAIADSMFKHQWRGEKEGAPAHPIGPYGEAYGRRKAHTEGREWTLAHRDNDARRVMTKALVEDLWRVWRGLPPLAGKHEHA